MLQLILLQHANVIPMVFYIEISDSKSLLMVQKKTKILYTPSSGSFTSGNPGTRSEVGIRYSVTPNANMLIANPVTMCSA